MTLRAVSTRLVAALALLCWGAIPAARDGDYLPPAAADRFLQDVEARGSALRTLLVCFEQERVIPGLQDPVVSRGLLAYSRPQRLHWEWEEPFPYLVVVDRGRVGRFERRGERLRQVRSPGDRAIGIVAREILSWIEGRYRRSSGLFRILVTNHDPPRIVLLPRGGDLSRYLQRIEVRFSTPPRVSTVFFRSENGEQTTIRFFAERRNTSLPERLFSPTDPRWYAGIHPCRGRDSTAAGNPDGP